MLPHSKTNQIVRRGDNLKSEQTNALEKALMQSTIEKRTFGCPEVTIGWYGKQRVDFMMTNTRGVIWCYEIKVSKPDFHSEHGHNFEGHYNYYVMTPELYKEVKDEIPDNVGVLVGKSLACKKRAKRKKITDKRASELRMFLIRSMSREVKKSYTSSDLQELAKLKRNLDFWRRSAESYRKELRYAKVENKKERKRKKI